MQRINEDMLIQKVIIPDIFSVAPPITDFECELVWLDVVPSSNENEFKISNMLRSSSNIKNLIQQAFNQPLNSHDQQYLLDEISKNSELPLNIGLTPKKLPFLVENNPLICFEILLRIMNTAEITEYYHVLVSMEITLHSMEVVNRLTTTVNLPSAFLNLYISNCITKCEMVDDKYMQSRLVRLVCVFLQSLIRNKLVNVKDLFIEIEAFCVRFSRVKEAVGLYRLLKHLEICDITPNSTSITITKSDVSHTK